MASSLYEREWKKQGHAASEGGLFGLHRNVIVLGVVSFLTDVSSEMLYPVVPIFLATVIGAKAAAIGIIEGIAESTASLLKLVSGVISDRLGKRRALVWVGYGLSAVVKPVFAVATAAWHVLALRFFDRVGKGLRTSPRDALIADSTNERTRGRAFGLHRAMDSAGAVIGPLLAYLLWRALAPGGHERALRWIFLISFIPAIIAVVVIALVRERRRVERAALERRMATFVPFWQMFRLLKPFDRHFRLLLLAVSLFQLGNSSDMFLLLRANDLMSPENAAAGRSLLVVNANVLLLWCMFNGIYTLTSLVAGPYSDRIGRRRVILVGFVVYGVVYMGFGLASRAVHAWILMISYGLYYGFTEGVLRAYVSDLCPAELKGTAYGLYHAVAGLMALPASILLGVLWQFVGAMPAFGTGAALALAAAVVLLTGVRETART